MSMTYTELEMDSGAACLLPILSSDCDLDTWSELTCQPTKSNYDIIVDHVHILL